MTRPDHRGAAGAVLSLLAMVLASPGAPEAAAVCPLTTNTCSFSSIVTTSHLQIGGPGSLSGERPASPGELSDGTIAEAHLGLTYDRLTGILTITVTNTTAGAATATGIFLNAPPQVSAMTLLSHTGSGPWELAFDSDRTDPGVDTHPQRDFIRSAGFGVFGFFLGNHGTDTQKEAGSPEGDIQAAGSVTFTIQVEGGIGDINACSFTSITSTIPPGDRLVVGLVRFQGGEDDGYGFVTPCQGPDLDVDLASFDAAPDDGHVAVRWTTLTERDNAGFAILRRDVRGGKVERLNLSLIPGNGSDVSGGTYLFVDSGALNGRKYHYMLEDWDLSGLNTIHRPVRAVPNPLSPPIRLLEPAYEGRLAPGTRLRWEGHGLRSSVEISPDPGFPNRETVVLRAGRRNERSLSEREIARLHTLGAAGPDHGLYWRVVGVNGNGRKAPYVSDVSFLATD